MREVLVDSFLPGVDESSSTTRGFRAVWNLTPSPDNYMVVRPGLALKSSMRTFKGFLEQDVSLAEIPQDGDKLYFMFGNTLICIVANKSVFAFYKRTSSYPEFNRLDLSTPIKVSDSILDGAPIKRVVRYNSHILILTEAGKLYSLSITTDRKQISRTLGSEGTVDVGSLFLKRFDMIPVGVGKIFAVAVPGSGAPPNSNTPPPGETYLQWVYTYRSWSLETRQERLFVVFGRPEKFPYGTFTDFFLNLDRIKHGSILAFTKRPDGKFYLSSWIEDFATWAQELGSPLVNIDTEESSERTYDLPPFLTTRVVSESFIQQLQPLEPIDFDSLSLRDICATDLALYAVKSDGTLAQSSPGSIHVWPFEFTKTSENFRLSAIKELDQSAVAFSEDSVYRVDGIFSQTSEPILSRIPNSDTNTPDLIEKTPVGLLYASQSNGKIYLTDKYSIDTSLQFRSRNFLQFQSVAASIDAYSVSSNFDKDRRITFLNFGNISLAFHADYGSITYYRYPDGIKHVYLSNYFIDPSTHFMYELNDLIDVDASYQAKSVPLNLQNWALPSFNSNAPDLRREFTQPLVIPSNATPINLEKIPSSIEFNEFSLDPQTYVTTITRIFVNGTMKWTVSLPSIDNDALFSAVRVNEYRAPKHKSSLKHRIVLETSDYGRIQNMTISYFETARRT